MAASISDGKTRFAISTALSHVIANLSKNSGLSVNQIRGHFNREVESEYKSQCKKELCAKNATVASSLFLLSMFIATSMSFIDIVVHAVTSYALYFSLMANLENKANSVFIEEKGNLEMPNWMPSPNSWKITLFLFNVNFGSVAKMLGSGRRRALFLSRAQGKGKFSFLTY